MSLYLATRKINYELNNQCVFLSDFLFLFIFICYIFF